MEAKPLGLRIPLLLVLLAGCGPSTYGSGNLVEEERETAFFSAVVLDDGISATIVVDPTQPKRVRLVGDDNLLERMETQVDTEENTLHIHFPQNEVDGWHSDNPLRAELTVPELESLSVSSGGTVDLSGALEAPALVLEASGGSRIEARGLNTQELTLEESGGSTVDLDGFAREVTGTLSGGSRLKGRGLGTHEAELTLSGGSTLELEVSDAINVTASGGSTLTVIGRPTVRSLELSGGSTLDFE